MVKSGHFRQILTFSAKNHQKLKVQKTTWPNVGTHHAQLSCQFIAQTQDLWAIESQKCDFSRGWHFHGMVVLNLTPLDSYTPSKTILVAEQDLLKWVLIESKTHVNSSWASCWISPLNWGHSFAMDILISWGVTCLNSPDFRTFVRKHSSSTIVLLCVLRTDH